MESVVTKALKEGAKTGSKEEIDPSAMEEIFHGIWDIMEAARRMIASLVSIVSLLENGGDDGHDDEARVVMSTTANMLSLLTVLSLILRYRERMDREKKEAIKSTVFLLEGGIEAAGAMLATFREMGNPLDFSYMSEGKQRLLRTVIKGDGIYGSVIIHTGSAGDFIKHHLLFALNKDSRQESLKALEQFSEEELRNAFRDGYGEIGDLMKDVPKNISRIGDILDMADAAISLGYPLLDTRPSAAVAIAKDAEEIASKIILGVGNDAHLLAKEAARRAEQRKGSAPALWDVVRELYPQVNRSITEI
jgi:hypothetical protein